MEEFIVRTSYQLPILLRAFRKTAKLTQADVAMRMGVTQQTVSAMERNTKAVSAERLMKLMSVLGVDLVLRSRPESRDYANSELQSLDDW
jgi:HTH-type transcriptional regulator/antitoxin HipB